MKGNRYLYLRKQLKQINMETKRTVKETSTRIEKACKQINTLKKLSSKLEKYKFFDSARFKKEFDLFITDTCNEYNVNEMNIRKILSM